MNFGCDLKIIYRNLLRNKTYALINILGLAIGLAVFIFIFVYIQYEFSYDRFHEHFKNIYRVELSMANNGQTTYSAGCPAPLADSIKKDINEIQNAARIIKVGTTLISYSNSKKFNIDNIFWTENSFFSIFSFKLKLGDSKLVLSKPNTAVISESIANKYFGVESPIGKKLRFNNVFDLEVVGVIENSPANSHFSYNILISFSTLKAQYGLALPSKWVDNWIPLYILTNNSAQANSIDQKLKTYLKKYQGIKSNNELYLKPLQKIHLQSNVNHELANNGDIKNIIALYMIAVFVLLIACINFMNLSTAYAANRAKEVGIKKVVGSSRQILIFQFVMESVLMAFISLLLALVLIEFLMPTLNLILDRNISFRDFEKPEFFAFLTILSIVVGILAGSYPALFLSSYQPVVVLKGSAKSGSRNSYLRRALVVLQFFISISLIIITIVIIQQVRYLNNKYLGYSTKNVLYVSLRNSSLSKISQFKLELMKNRNILQISAHDNLPNASTNWTGISWPDAGQDQYIKINVNYVDADFVKTYKINVSRGSDFTIKQEADTLNYIILNETAAREMGRKNPIGQKIILYGDYRNSHQDSATIVGVVKDYHFQSLHQKISPLMMILLNNGMSGITLSIRTKSEYLPETLKFIQGKFDLVFPEEAFDYRLIADDFNITYEEELKMSVLVSYFALLAIIIASLGLFGLISFTISQRTKEIGLRKVLGASVLSIFKQLIREFLILLIISDVLALPIAYLIVSGWLKTFPYHIGINLWAFVIATILAMFIAVFTIGYKVLRAAFANPIESLRYE